MLGDPINYYDSDGLEAQRPPLHPILMGNMNQNVLFGRGPGGRNCVIDGMEVDPDLCQMLGEMGALAPAAPILPATMQDMGGAVAKAALSLHSCQNLFGVSNSAQLQDIIDTPMIQYVTSLPQDADAETYTPTDPHNPDPGQYVIQINTQSLDYAVGDPGIRAQILIHELLHVAYDMGYAVDGGDWTQRDGGSTNANRINSNLVFTDCGVGVYIP